MRYKLLFGMYGALALAPLSSFGQTSTVADPADASARSSAVKYESAFAEYRSYKEQELAPWRDINDEVARIGGHVGMFGGHGGHARGSESGPIKPPVGQPAGAKPQVPAGQPPARSAPQAPSGGHQGH